MIEKPKIQFKLATIIKILDLNLTLFNKGSVFCHGKHAVFNYIYILII